MVQMLQLFFKKDITPTNKWASSWDFGNYHICVESLFISLCRLPITFTNSFDPDLDPNCLTLWSYSWKIFWKSWCWKKNSRWQKSRKNFLGDKGLIIHAQLFSGGTGLNICLSLHLSPYFVFVSREGSSKKLMLKKNQQTTKKQEKFPRRQRVNHPCTAVQWGYRSKYLPEPSFLSLLCVCEQRRLWSDCMFFRPI